jgi:hypothetical protein
MKQSSTMAPPQGLTFGPKNKYRIGRKLGDGVCGAVYELSPPGWAIKLAKMPSDSKKKQEKRFVDLLYYESLIYLNHLNHLRGDMIPEVLFDSGLQPAGNMEGTNDATTIPRKPILMDTPRWDGETVVCRK